jgi:hypothetical protein
MSCVCAYAHVRVGVCVRECACVRARLCACGCARVCVRACVCASVWVRETRPALFFWFLYRAFLWAWGGVAVKALLY